MEKVKLIPYGISKFLQVRNEDLYYSDKTMFLKKMEDAGHFLFLVRPRRFGKSNFVSMMCTYYDINAKEKFDENFSGLYVHEHPTREMGKYQVLSLDFSQVGGDSHSVEERFEEYGCLQLDDFAVRYEKYYDAVFKDIIFKQNTFAGKLTWIASQAKNAGYRLYLIIDEYDNFTNDILNQEGKDVYRAMTHATGFYRKVFMLFKPNFNRIFMMGVSPVTLDDLTSGFNIATNISADYLYDTMLGLSEDEVRTMIRYYQQVGLIKADEDELIADMKPWYDNYCFTEESFSRDPKMFNTDMVCYYLDYYIKHGHEPKERLDPNTMTDYKKLRNLVRLESLDNKRLNIINTIAEQGYIYGNIKRSFPAERIADEDNFISLLYYYGMLTITGVRGSRLKLGIPNNNVRLQYYEFLRYEFTKHERIDTSELQDGFDSAAFDGDWKPMMTTITDAYKDNSTVRSMIEGERNIQGFMSAFFSLNPYYLIAPEVELNHGYCDFFFLPDHSRYADVAHSYIIELKYLKKDASESEATQQWDDAVEQIKGYAQGKVVQHLLDGTKLHLVIVQIKGYEAVRMEEVRCAADSAAQ